MLHWPVSVLAGLYLLLSDTSSTVRAFTVGSRARSSLERKIPFTSFRLKMTPSHSSCHSKDFPPPIARRELDRVVLAGKLPDNPDNSSPKSLIRQAESSVEKLLDPPRSVSDPYGWLRDDDRTNEEVLEHLRKENEYTAQITRHLEPLRDKLYSELLSSIQETDYTTPNMKDNSWYYYTRTFEGDAYTVYCRAPYTQNSDPFGQGEMHTWDGTREMQVLKDEEIYLNVNELAKGHEYCSVSSVTTASKSSHNLFAYAVDFTGDEIYEIVVRDFNTGEIVDKVDHVDCYGSVLFGAGEHEIFYITVDEAQRPYQVWRRRIGEEAVDELVFEQPDELFWTGISKTSDNKYLLIETSSSETSEVHYLNLSDDDAKLKCIAKKREKVLYDVDHWNGYWIITSNVGGTLNMRLMISPVGQEDTGSSWEDVTMIDDVGSVVTLFDGGAEKALDGIETFENHWVASGRFGGIPRVWIMKVDKLTNANDHCVSGFTQLEFEESAYDVGINVNYNYNTDKVVVYYNSMTTPIQSIQIDMNFPNDITKRTILKSKTVPGYVKEKYGCDRMMVRSRDGTTDIPISLVYRRDIMDGHLKSGKPVHVHLVGYGSYGACSEADFSANRLPLLNRGVVYVMAHIRGGGEMGRQWYEEPNGGKFLCKMNTFNDFVDIARWLIETKKLSSPDKLSIEGRSAGGLLIGASINQAPELFTVAILGVPFVDVVCTMVDSSIPLTVGEWLEWGNPNEERFFDYMMSYSPINNVKHGSTYPACLLTGGLHDPRVQFWEPAKFTAELRHGMDNDLSGPICLKMDMSAGHFSASDRYKYLKELSFDYAFLLDQLGLSELQ